MKKIIILIPAILVLISPLYSNEYINSYYNTYFEFLAVGGLIESPTLVYHSYSNNTWNNPGTAEVPWGDEAVRETTVYKTDSGTLSIIAPELFNSYNSKYPHGINDGALWQGRGYNTRLRSGISYLSEYFSITLAPEVLYMQNREFPLMPSAAESRYGYISNGIDNPQRFGDDSIRKFNRGETDVRLNIGKFTLGVSNENVKIGPASVNPLLLSGNASGFPHIDMGIRKWKTPIGQIEGRLLWGLLEESDYFDSDSGNNYRYFNVMSLAYSPVFWPEFTAGFARTIMCNSGDFQYQVLDNLFNPLMDPSLGYDKNDQKASVFFDFNLTDYFLKLYAECAYEDHLVGRGILLIPGHTLAYTFGLKKGFQIYKDHYLSLNFELTELQQSRSYEITMGVGGGWYRHHIVTQGHTENGQILGAGIGTGANSQYMSLDYYNKHGMVGISMTRLGRDNDYIYKDPVLFSEGDSTKAGFFRMNVEMTYGITCLLFMENMALSFNYSFCNNFNRDYTAWNYVENHYFEAGINYKI